MSGLTQKEFAKLGGNAVVTKYGKSYMKELAKKSVAVRKAKKDSEAKQS